jgi:hypothetical protein
MAAITQDSFFSQLFQTGLADPNSKVYLPQVLLQTSNPSLNPYTMSSLNLGSQNIGGVQINVLLTNVVIGGIPNVTVAQNQGGVFTLVGLNATMTTQFGLLSPPPPGVATTLSFAADFTLSFPGNQLTGSLSISISQAALTALMVISGDQLLNIVITLNSLVSAVPATAIITPVVTFNPASDFWSTLFQNFLKKQSTVTTIVGQINQQISAPSLLASLSSELTTVLQNAIQKQIGS